MSAITGIFLRDSREVEQGQMKKMNECLAHRGLDGSNIYVKGPVGFGQQMLWTTPESLKEKLPFSENNLAITSDARIDNREELLKLLNLENSHKTSDSQLILKAYQKWGENCPEKLIGDFAFVIWDEQNKNLFCARDHMGVKPFYYYLSDDIFVFASEIKALFSISDVPRQLNEFQIAEHLGFILENKEKTFYKNIYRLPPATSLSLNFEKMIFNQYWALDPTVKLQLDSDEDYEKEFLKIFTEAVNCRLRTLFPAGSMLSGGLDTSSVVCIAREILNKDKRPILKTFSAVFNEVPECDEQHFINMVLSEGGLDPYYVHADQISPLGEVDDFFWHGDQPFLFPNIFMLWNLYKEAQKRDIRVLLDGFDGDTTVSYGNGLYSDLLKSGKWNKFIKEINEASKLHEIRPYNLLASKMFLTFIPNSLKRLKWSLTKFTPFDNRNSKIIHKKFVQDTELIEHLRKAYENELNIKNSREFHHYYIESGLVQLELEQLDWAAARFGIEPRHPFYDKRLIEFCLAIPTEQKRQNGWDRAIMRRAMKSVLPEGVRNRVIKTDFSPNFNKSMLKYERKQLDNLIMKNPSVIEKYVDIHVLKKEYEHYLSGNARSTNELWDIITLALWLQKTNLNCEN